MHLQFQKGWYIEAHFSCSYSKGVSLGKGHSWEIEVCDQQLYTFTYKEPRSDEIYAVLLQKGMRVQAIPLCEILRASLAIGNASSCCQETEGKQWEFCKALQNSHCILKRFTTLFGSGVLQNFERFCWNLVGFLSASKLWFAFEAHDRPSRFFFANILMPILQ